MIETVIDDFIFISFIGCHVEEKDMKGEIDIKANCIFEKRQTRNEFRLHCKRMKKLDSVLNV